MENVGVAFIDENGGAPGGWLCNGRGDGRHPVPRHLIS
jgi:hypothetical protein